VIGDIGQVEAWDRVPGGCLEDIGNHRHAG
jgi:hypothetical protein